MTHSTQVNRSFVNVSLQKKKKETVLLQESLLHTVKDENYAFQLKNSQ